ncbi:MAG TPA: hypothetical protein VFQ19_02070, partial [Nocardioidaceae bacterium]|nr:hypothetical protein [Nocardioidaceae bacterium]
SFVVALAIGLALKFTMGVRISEEEELVGIDTAQHGESGYDLPANGEALRLDLGSSPPEPAEKIAAKAQA